MCNRSFLRVLVIWLYVHICTVDSQEPCSSPDPNIAGIVIESTFATFDPNSSLYRTDTTIEGISQGTATASGVNITIVRSAATPPDLNLDSLFELVTLIVANSPFGSRTFIRLKSAIDRDGSSYVASDDLDTVEFILSCRSLKDPTETKFFLMQLEIRDINDNAPIFRNAPYSASVDESAPVGTTVYSGITATDLDAGSNKEIEYAIVPGDGSINDGSTKFALPITSRGEIVVSSSLDFESVQSYTLTISATDKASNVADRKQTTTTITITINDMDDLGPKFVYSSCFNVNNVCFNPTYTTTVTSGLSEGNLVFYPVPVDSDVTKAVNIIAQDGDTLHASITFTLRQTLPAGYQNRFQVTTQQVSGSANQYQAFINQTIAIDRSQAPELELYVEAKENSTHQYSDRATIKLTFAAANTSNQTSYKCNNYSPIFSAPIYFVNILEGNYTKKNQRILMISATDDDFDDIEYDIQSVSNNGDSVFSLASNKEGKAAIACVGTIAKGETFAIVVRATDRVLPISRRRSSSVQIEVNVGPFGTQLIPSKAAAVPNSYSMIPLIFLKLFLSWKG